MYSLIMIYISCHLTLLPTHINKYVIRYHISIILSLPSHLLSFFTEGISKATFLIFKEELEQLCDFFFMAVPFLGRSTMSICPCDHCQWELKWEKIPNFEGESSSRGTSLALSFNVLCFPVILFFLNTAQFLYDDITCIIQLHIILTYSKTVAKGSNNCCIIAENNDLSLFVIFFSKCAVYLLSFTHFYSQRWLKKVGLTFYTHWQDTKRF